MILWQDRSSILWFLLMQTPLNMSWLLSIWFNESQSQNGNIITNNITVSRVLDFLPEPIEQECLSADKRHLGICMRKYKCRMHHGASPNGLCAFGFGICCTFITTCGKEVQNNVSYITSPEFPNLINQAMNCTVVVKKINHQVTQLRIDFLHFNIGQPDRRTGNCDDDVLMITTGNKTLKLCGWNSGQHLYLDIEMEIVTFNFILPGNLTSRMWELQVIQIAFEQRAPAGCLQYMQSINGTIKTFNYLPNGRYLANQRYLICIRQEFGMCSVSYTPCTGDSFKIGNPRKIAVETLLTTTSLNPENNEDYSHEEGSGLGLISGETPFQNFRCHDRIIIYCDSEEFFVPDAQETCDFEYCGTSLCDKQGSSICRIESSAQPFQVIVDFGPAEKTKTPLEDNIGMCLSYEQLPCIF